MEMLSRHMAAFVLVLCPTRRVHCHQLGAIRKIMIGAWHRLSGVHSGLQVLRKLEGPAILLQVCYSLQNPGMHEFTSANARLWALAGVDMAGNDRTICIMQSH
jgi:hypothetical protein